MNILSIEPIYRDYSYGNPCTLTILHSIGSESSPLVRLRFFKFKSLRKSVTSAINRRKYNNSKKWSIPTTSLTTTSKRKTIQSLPHSSEQIRKTLSSPSPSRMKCFAHKFCEVRREALQSHSGKTLTSAVSFQ